MNGVPRKYASGKLVHRSDSSASFDEVSPTSFEDARSRLCQTSAYVGSTGDGDDFCIDIEKLLLSSPKVKQFLDGMSKEARQIFLKNVRRRLMKEGAPILLPRDNEQPLIAHVATGVEGAPEHRAVSLTDLYDFSVPCEETLRLVFNLTPAEARLAQGIARGDSLDEIAMSLGIKMPTARTQLAAVFAKTETRRQAKLVAILTRLAVLIG